MALGPILPGRIPASLAARRLERNLTTSSRELLRLQDQIATGQKFLRPGESPAAAVRSLVLQATLERQEQLKVNVQTSRSLVQATEGALTEVGTALTQAQSFALSGIGDTSSSAEKQAMAIEVQTLLRQVVDVANTEFRGRYLFGGSESRTAPFELTADGVVRYRGDVLSIDSFAASELLVANNVDGVSAFGATPDPVTGDTNPALTLGTRLADLHGGQGIELGTVVVTLDNGGTPQTRSVDLTGADTIQDVKTRLEDAFASGPLTLTVGIDPATNSGMRLTSSAGTVSVADVPGSRTAADLGIDGSAAAQITGGDLDPTLTLQTTLAALNGGTGIGATAGFGLRIVNGTRTSTVDLSSATTVEDLFNALRLADPDLLVGINDAGNGLSITSRLSGVDFSIGENGGQNAARLGIRTFTAGTSLSDLNGGLGVPVDTGGPLEIVRRDGTTVAVNLAGAKTVQEVLDRINAVDPGVLSASLNAVGNGISIRDDDGASTGPLTVKDGNVAQALGLVGTEPGSDRTVPLAGGDVNPRAAAGVFGLLAGLQRALVNEDDRELQRLSGLITREIDRFNQVRGDVGSRLKLFEDLDNRLADENVRVRETLASEFEVDPTEVITRVGQVQTTFQATLQVAAQTWQLTLLNYL